MYVYFLQLEFTKEVFCYHLFLKCQLKNKVWAKASAENRNAASFLEEYSSRPEAQGGVSSPEEGIY